jgi:hypothetical protein
MQKLEERNTYTPTGIPHTRSNCGLPLNREETLSVSGLKTSSNAPMRLSLVSDCSRTGLASPMLQKQPLSYRKKTISGFR